LIEVVQFLGMTDKKGVLNIFNEKEAGCASLYFDKGILVHAVSGDSKGLGVLYSTLSRETGYFKFLSDEEAPEVTIEKPIHILLLESQKYMDELNHLQSKLPPEESILYIQPYLDKVPPMNTFEWQIISLTNGRRSIRRICEKIGDELSAKTAIFTLLSKGILSCAEEEPAWVYLIPLHIPESDVNSDRFFPPLLRTNLLLKTMDGKLTLKDLMFKLNLKGREIAEDIKLLYDCHWIKFQPDQERIFLRFRTEM